MNVPATFHALAAALLPLTLLSDCAATSANTLPKYQAPPTGILAAVINVGPHGHAWSIDGAETPPFAKTLHLAPGEHRVGINCLSFEISIEVIPAGPLPPLTPVFIPNSTAQFGRVTGPFVPGRPDSRHAFVLNCRP